MGAIEAYVAELGANLSGPRRAKGDLLAEARDGLIDAAEAYAAQGLPADEAERRAVADFGPIAEVAPAYQTELGYAQTVRTALLMCLVLALQDPAWDLTTRILGGSSAVADAPRPGFAVISGLLSPLGAVALAASVLAAFAGGIGVRWFRQRRWVVRATAHLAFGVAGTFTAAGLLIVALGPTPALAAAGLPAVALLVVAPMLLVARSGRDCLAAT